MPANLHRFQAIIPASSLARHDAARRMDCGLQAEPVMEHRMEEWEADELAQDLACNRASKAYEL